MSSACGTSFISLHSEIAFDELLRQSAGMCGCTPLSRDEVVAAIHEGKGY